MEINQSSREAESQNIKKVLLQAVVHHQSGQLQEAKTLYQAILQTQPHHAEANHNMGVLTAETEKPAAALPYFMAALEAEPTHGQYWLSYIHALIQGEQLEAAREVLEIAIKQGLDGVEVEVLVDLLKGEMSPSEHIGLVPQHELKELPANQQIEHQISKKKLAKKSAKPKKVATHKAPPISPQEINALVALFNQGRYVEVEVLAQTMTARYPSHGFGWKILGAVYKQMGRNIEALTPMQKALLLSPGDAEVHNNLGAALHELDRLDEAETSYRRALQIKPSYASAHNNLGNTLNDLGRLSEAEACYKKSLQIKPDNAEVYSNLGVNLQGQGRVVEAEACYRRSLQIKPDNAEAYSNLGVTLQEQGRMDEAEASYRLALQANPYNAEAHSNLGSTLKDMGKLEEAAISCRQALQIKPDYPEAYIHLGNTLKDMGLLGEAEASYRRALQVKPDYAEAYICLGATLQTLGRLKEAETNYRRALQIKPNYALAHSNLGSTLKDMGKLDEAEVCFRRALQIKSNFSEAYNNLLFCLSLIIGVESQTLFAEHVSFGEQFETPLRASWPVHDNSRDPERCLQIGIVSGDLRFHAVASFIEPILAQLSLYSHLSLHAYATHKKDDDTSQRLRKYFKHWHQVAGLLDVALADKIRKDNIDILIDLSGHTAKNRLLTFARKPAPVQVSWLGYPGTTGLRAMDYYLADRHYLPPGQFDNQFTEKIVHMPVNVPFQPSTDAPPVNALPSLGNGYVTFGSFNRPNKLSHAVVSLWAEILRAVPTSKMLLGAMPEEGQYDTLLNWFAEEGIARERLSFYPRSNTVHYLGLHQQVDFCLDTFPYNGGTTTLHALWMGVPTLTLAGSTAAGRSGASNLGQLGLDGFIAHDTADFVQKGLFWADNLSALSELRAGMRERFAQSRIGQPAVAAAGVERALRIMWQRWCEGLQAESFEVSLHGNNSANHEAEV